MQQWTVMIYVDGEWMYRMHGNQVGYHSPLVFADYNSAVEESLKWNEAIVQEYKE